MGQKKQEAHTIKEKENVNPVFIASAPNAQPDDRTIARKLLLSPGRWHGDNARKEVEALFADMHNVDNAYAFDTGRASLAALLNAIPLKSGDEVVIQAYTCLAVPLAIRWAGGVPIYTDIAENSFNPDPAQYASKITRKTRAVIVQHTFGEPAAIDEIRAVIDSENEKRPQDLRIILIEDCAHALGTSYKGKKIGTWGDAAFFSVGQEKVISCTKGGLALSTDPQISKALSTIHAAAPRQRKRDILKAILHPTLWNIICATYYIPPLTGKATIGRVLIVLFRALTILEHQADPSSISFTPTIQKLSHAQAIMLKNQFGKLDDFIKHRREIVRVYNTTLPRTHRIESKHHGYLRFPLRVTNRRDFERHLKQHRIIAGNWYVHPVHPMCSDLRRLNYTPGSCPRAEQAGSESINLPTGPNVSIKDAQRIARAVLTYTSP